MPTFAPAAAKKSAKFLQPGPIAALASFLVALAAAAAHARAGGGGGYSAGGGSYGGSGIGIPIALLDLDFRFILAYPLYGIPINAAIVWLYILTHSTVRETVRAQAIIRGARARGWTALSDNVRALRERDPLFDLDAFLDRARAAFLKIQEAWSAQNMGPARAFISDGVMERFSIQIAMQIDERIRNKLEQVKVLSMGAIQAVSGERFDTIYVRFKASAVDTDVAITDGRKVRGDEEPQEFEEVWSFIRRSSAKTSGRPGLIEGHCPQCGAALQASDAAQCPSCRSWLNAGTYDWVLSGITQACEWSEFDPDQDIPGFAEASQRDPELDAQFLEDRASAVFWRWQYAIWKADPSILRSIATDACCQSLERAWEANGNIYKDASVGGVGVAVIERTGEWETARVVVRWSADSVTPAEKQAKKSRNHALFSHVVTLVRKPGTQTNPRAGFSSLCCPNCGAPPERRDQSSCEYCGTLFNDGTRSWVLSELIPEALWPRPAAPAAEVSAMDRTAWASMSQDAWVWAASPVNALAVMAGILGADGGLNDGQARQVMAFGSKNGIPWDRIQDIVAAGRAGRVELPQPKDTAQAEACLRGMIRLSLVRGKLTSGEKKVFLGFGSKVKLTPEQIRFIFKSEKENAYREAKAALAAAKASLS